jgi:hypothetical protein
MNSAKPPGVPTLLSSSPNTELSNNRSAACSRLREPPSCYQVSTASPSTTSTTPAKSACSAASRKNNPRPLTNPLISQYPCRRAALLNPKSAGLTLLRSCFSGVSACEADRPIHQVTACFRAAHWPSPAAARTSRTPQKCPITQARLPFLAPKGAESTASTRPPGSTNSFYPTWTTTAGTTAALPSQTTTPP